MADRYKILAEFRNQGRKAHDKGQWLITMGPLADKAMKIIGDDCSHADALLALRAGWYDARGMEAASLAVDKQIAFLDVAPTASQTRTIRGLAERWYTELWTHPDQISFRVHAGVRGRLRVVARRNQGHLCGDLSQWFIGPRGGLSAIDGCGKRVTGTKAIAAGKI